MSVILEISYSKKVGLPAYSSHSCSVTLRTELGDLSQLEKTNAELYARLQASVDTQLVNAGHVPNETAPTNRLAPASTPANRVMADAWKCSDKQRDLILKIASEHALSETTLGDLAQSRFGQGVRQLNKVQASALIDELIETYPNTRGGRPAYAGGRR